MLITQYFASIESQIADCIHVFESHILKDHRSLHIGIVEGNLVFFNETFPHHKHIFPDKVVAASRTVLYLNVRIP